VATDRQNFWLHVTEGCFASFGYQMVGGAILLPPLIKTHLGGSPVIIGLMMSFISIGTLFQFFSVRALERIPKKKAVVLFFGFWMRLPLAAIALALWLWGPVWPGRVLVAIVVCRLVMSVSMQINYPPWMDMLGDTVREDWRGRYFGYRQFISALAAFGASGLVLLVLDRWGFPDGYAMLIGAAFLSTMVSWVVYCFVNDTPDEAAKAKEPRHEPFVEYLRTVPRLLSKDRAFRRFLLYILLGTIAGSAGMFRAVAGLETYGLPDKHLGTFIAVGAAGAMAGSLLFGHLGDRYGHKRNLVAASTIMVLCNSLAAFAPTAGLYSVTFFLQGLAMGAFMASFMSYLLERAPAKIRMRYASVQGLLMVPVGLLAPVGAGKLVELSGYDVLFTAAACLQLGAVLVALSLPRRNEMSFEPE